MNKKISIITPVYNCKDYIEECILSVKKQNYDKFEHIIIDGGSNDGTIPIIRKYENTYNMVWISEPDKGMYDAICKGFAMASGEIYAWLNADDMYQQNAFRIVATVMNNSKIQWCTGFPITYSPDGIIYNLPRVIPVYLRSFLRRGYADARFGDMVQQESTFWTKELWYKAGGELIRKYKLAGDYWLWVEFAKHEKLYTLDAPLSGFRKHYAQKSSDLSGYYYEIGNLTIPQKILKYSKLVKIITYLFAIFSDNLIIEIENIIDEII